MTTLIVDGEPYKYIQAKRRTALHALNGLQHTIVEPGEYIVIDRYFETIRFTEAEWNEVMNRAFKQFKRARSGSGGADGEDQK